MTVFDRQERAWRDAVLGRDLPRIGIEAGVRAAWGGYGCAAVLGVDTFGESGPAAALFEHFGLTVEALVDQVQQVLARPEPSEAAS